jgi:hypothetical protein
MQEKPLFLTSPMPLKAEEAFRPQTIPFRGGWIAWAATVIIGGTMVFIWLQKGSFQCMTISFFIFFLLASILITFNHWIDSNTVIKATQSQLSYHSPIKKSLHRWDQIQSLRARRVSRSWRVFIDGTNSSFFIRVKSPTAPEDYRGRILDLPRGEELVGIIMNKAQLSQCELRNNEWICTRSQ